MTEHTTRHHQAGRQEYDALGQILDRQILDDHGRMIGKVDDLELEERDDGTLAVTALLTGPGALGPRLGGALGAVTTRGWSRLTGRSPDAPNRIDLGHVATIRTVITLAVSHTGLDVEGLEDWVRTRIVAALPGAGTDPR
jgi:sporulation protein YlmC with PRC-barrel domain